MIIGVDAACLAVTEERLKVGVFYSTLSLLRELTRLDRKSIYRLYSFIPIQAGIMSQLGANVENVVVTQKRLWLSVGLSTEFLRRKYDVFLGFNQALPFYHSQKSIVVIHDLAFELFPNAYDLKAVRKLSWQTKYAVKYASRIISVSQSTKKDLMRIYKVPSEKISVVHHGIDDIFTPQDEIKILQMKKKYKIDSNYFLFLGSLKRVKNILNILKAFKMFKKNTHKVKLILLGSDYWITDEIRNQLIELSQDIIYPGYVARSDLPAFYAGAIALVSPSYYEGFGLPILESMACGTPVITSPVGSITEIVDEAAALVNPESVEEIKDAMQQLSGKPELRNTLIQKGLIQAKKFSWEKAARRYFDIIHTV